jgi:hypothetical protein
MARLGALSIVGLLCGTACDKQTQGPSQEQPSQPSARIVADHTKVHELGETARGPHFELSVKNVKTCSVEPHFQPPAGVRKLGVELEIAGLSDTQVPVNPFYAIVQAEDGTRFEATLAGCTPVLEATRVTAGQHASGWVTFDVPDEMRAAELSYSPVMIGAKRSAVIFSLEL